MKRRRKKADRKTLSFFLIAFPTVLVAAIGILGAGTATEAFIQVALVFYQFILLKQFIDTYYQTQ